MADRTTIEIRGLKETKLALRESGKVMRREIRQQFKILGEVVAVEARKIARNRGLEDKGKLISSIRPQAREFSVVVKAGAKRKSRKYAQGYNYPRRYEYEKGGWRAFMRPALKNKQDEVFVRFREIVATVGRRFKGG